MIRVISWDSPLVADRVTQDVDPGGTVREVLASSGVLVAENFAVALNGQPIRGEWLDTLRPEKGDLVTATRRPGEVATGIAAVSAALSSLTAAEIVVGAIIGTAALYGGYKLSQSLAPPAPEDPDTGREGIRTSIVGEANSLPLYAPIPQILGRHKIRPPYAALPYSAVEGGKLYGYYLFTLGKGPIEFEDLRIGDDPLFKEDTTLTYGDAIDADGEAWQNIRVQLRKGEDGEAAQTLYSDTYEQVTVNQRLRADAARERRTPTGTTSFAVIISFDALIQITNRGKYKTATVRIKAEYRAVGETTWRSAGNIVCSGMTRGSKHFEKDFESRITGDGYTDADGYEFEVRLTRQTANATDPGVLDVSNWAAIVAVRAGEPVAEEGVALIAIKCKMTNQLPSGIDDFNLVGKMEALDWNGSIWLERETSNPASVYRHVMQGSGNALSVADSELDLDELQAWHDECETNGWEYNSVIGTRGKRTVFQVLQEVCAAGRASLTVLDGKFSVVRENRLTGSPVQLFTPKNSWGFQVQKQLLDLPDAFTIDYVDEAEGWIESSRIVPRDGFTETSAELLERLELPGVTSWAQAYKLGRYHLAVLENRPTIYTLSVDWEQMNVIRGDWVKVQHDAVMVGQVAGRVTVVNLAPGPRIVGVDLDETVTMEAGKSYGIEIRTDDTSIYRSVNLVIGETNTVTFTQDVQPDDAIVVGDLFAFGEAKSETKDCIVYKILPGDEYGAQIALLDAATSDVLAHEDEEVPDDEPLVTVDEAEPPETPDVDEPVGTIPTPPPIVENDPPATDPPRLPGRRGTQIGITIPITGGGKKRKKKRRRRRRKRAS